jgi:uncharacterized membrane protein YbhN (UPF0104 family)
MHIADVTMFYTPGSGGVELSFTALLAPTLDHATLGAVLLMWRFATYYWYLIAGAPVFALFVGKALWQHLGNGASKMPVRMSV